MSRQKVEEVLTALTSLEQISISAYQDALKSHLALSGWDMLNDAPQTIYNEAPSGDSQALQQFKVQTIVLGLSRSSGYGFDRTVNASGLDKKMDVAVSSIAHSIYRDYLENAVKEAGRDRPDLLELEKNVDFCTAFANYILDKDFIDRTLIATYLSTSTAYPQAIAYIYERVRSTLASTDEHAPTSRFSAQDLWRPHVEQNSDLAEAGKTEEFIDTCLPVKWSNEQVLQGPSFPLLGQRISVQWRSSQDWVNQVNEMISVVDKEPNYSTPVGTGRNPPIPMIGSRTYGKRLQQWIEGKRAQHSDLFTGVHPDNYEAAKPGYMSCFVAGTQVRTVDGDVSIELLGGGTKVLTKAPGEYGVLSDEKPMFPTTGKGDFQEYVFGFNGQKPFVTGGHIFFTTAGPKAINPTAAREENPQVMVSQLRVGDVLYQLDDENEKGGYAKVPIESFTVERAPCDFVYGLHFAQGSHGGARYHANGYLVAANYPEITLKRFEDRLRSLPVREQRSSVDAIQALPNALGGVFGSLLDTFKNTFTPDKVPQFGDPQGACYQARKNTERSRVSASSLTMAFALQPLHGAAGPPGLPEVWLNEGAVMVDSKFVSHAEVTHHQVRWSREQKPGLWEHGLLHLSSDGLLAFGAVATEENQVLSKATHVVGAPVQQVYTPKGTKVTFKDSDTADGYRPKPEDQWLDFWSIRVFMEQTEKGTFIAKASIPVMDELSGSSGKDAIYTSSVDFSPGQLKVTLRIGDGLEDTVTDMINEWNKPTPKPQPFKSLVLYVKIVPGEVRGHYTEIVEEPGEEGPIHAVHADHSDKHRELNKKFLAAIASSPIAHLNYGLNCNLYSISANIHAAPSPKTAVLREVTSDRPLSIGELQTLDIPGDFDVHRVTQNYVMAAAGYWRGEKEKSVFGDGKGANEKILPDSLKSELMKPNQTFLADVYTRALFLYNLSTSDQYQEHFTDEQKEKLEYFWSGKGQTCISRRREFAAINNLACGASFVDQVPRLKDYINDSSKDWADLFYRAVSDDDYLNQMAFSKLSGTNPVNKCCQILNALDKQNRGYPEKLWKLILSKSIMILSYEGAPMNADGFMNFAVVFVEQLITRIKTKDPSITKELQEDLGFDIMEMEKQYNTTSARELASFMFGMQGELGRLLSECVREAGIYIGKKNLTKLATVINKVKEKADKHLSEKTQNKLKKTYKGFVKLCAIAAQGYQLASAIKYLADWNDLSDVDRAKAILQVVESTCRLIGEVAPIIKQLGENAFNSVRVQRILGQWNNRVGGPRGRASVPSNDTEVPILDTEKLAGVNSKAEQPSLEGQIGETTSDAMAEEKLTMWAKATKVGGLVLKGVVMLSNLATVVGLGFQIEKEWGSEKAGIIAMDIINMAAVGTQVVVETLEIGLAVFGVESTVLPLIGAVAALVGIIIMFIEMGVQHSAPEDPTVKYIKEEAPTFVKDLSSRPTTKLTYDMPSEAPKEGSWQFQLNITDETKSNLTIEAFHITIPVGNVETDLFARPEIKEGSSDPPENRIQCTVSDPNGFIVKSAISPNRDNHTMLFQVAAKDKTAAFGQLQVTFTGTLNGMAGKSNINIKEIPPKEGKGKPEDSRMDLVKNMTIQKR